MTVFNKNVSESLNNLHNYDFIGTTMSFKNQMCLIDVNNNNLIDNTRRKKPNKYFNNLSKRIKSAKKFL